MPLSVHAKKTAQRPTYHIVAHRRAMQMLGDVTDVSVCVSLLDSPQWWGLYVNWLCNTFGLGYIAEC